MWLRSTGLVAIAIASACTFDRSGPGLEDGDGGTEIDAARPFDSAPGTADAALLDGGEADAGVTPTTCEEACDGIGTCEGETCAIDCNGDDCDNQVECPAGIECRVRCPDNDSCAGGVDCTQATGCRVECGGNGSCGNEILCGAGPCDVTCSGPNSCANGTTCDQACSCRVECTGGSSCDGEAVCPLEPEETCVDGRGCTRNPDGCDVC
jgi:hypothetical protein